METGFPISTSKRSENGEETPLQHTKGVSLWCLKWTVEKADGKLSLDCEDMTAAIELPAVE